MLAVQHLRGPSGGDDPEDGTTATMGSFPGRAAAADEGSFLGDISFSDLFMGMDGGDDIFPDLEMDPADIFAEISSGCNDDGDYAAGRGEEDYSPASAAVAEQLEKDGGSAPAAAVMPYDEAGSASPDDGEKGRKLSVAKGSSGKRKAKVDWTPDLHRRFVQVVEQLGMEKAVPSRILELIGVDCLTRHNIASHLQAFAGKRGGGGKLEPKKANLRRRCPSHRGFIPPPPRSQPPLHVWGHPPAEAPPLHMWPQRPPWHHHIHPPQLDTAASFWHHHYQIRAFARPQIVPGILPHHQTAAVLRSPAFPSSTITQSSSNSSSSQLRQIDAHPTKESIDAAIGDVVEKPWLPLPLGLKSPSLDSVLVELQKQGVSKIPSFIN